MQAPLSDKEKIEMLNWLASQEMGKKILRWIVHDVCQYNITSIGYENGMVSAYASLFNEARKDIWRTLRAYIFASHLVNIESYDMVLQQEKLEELQKLSSLEEQIDE